jgi:probable rRNA maturation factor
MDMQIDIECEDPRWDDAGLEALCARAAAGVAARFGLNAALCELSVLGCDDARIAGLNAEFRDKPTPTNVLSWPAEERAAEAPGAAPELPEADIFGAIALGDLAIAYDTCAREAADQGKALADHVTHLLVHGLLHLLGYDHIREEDAQLMEEIEVQILDRMGIVNPYDA